MWQSLLGVGVGVFSASLILFAVVRFMLGKWRKQSSDCCRPATPPRPGCWNEKGEKVDDDDAISGRDTSRQPPAPFSGSNLVQSIEGEASLELEPEILKSPGSCWGRISADSTRKGDYSTAYDVPPQSPGSRHAFVNRLSGPRRLSSPSHSLSSPGCVPDNPDKMPYYRPPEQNMLPSSPHHNVSPAGIIPRSSPHYGCRGAARYLGDGRDQGRCSAASSPSRLLDSCFDEVPSPHGCKPNHSVIDRRSGLTPSTILPESDDSLLCSTQLQGIAMYRAKNPSGSTCHDSGVCIGNHDNFNRGSISSASTPSTIRQQSHICTFGCGCENEGEGGGGLNIMPNEGGGGEKPNIMPNSAKRSLNLD
jgi:hypothetical protein